MTLYYSRYSLSDVAYQPHVEYVPQRGYSRPEWMCKTTWQRVNVWLTTHKPTELGWKCLMNEARRSAK